MFCLLIVIEEIEKEINDDGFEFYNRGLIILKYVVYVFRKG